ncbi:hypothetical protein SALBM311S_04685 [Streptomyces alboniger]
MIRLFLMYPNSPVGIGVMSYFMLANEIEVTTAAWTSEVLLAR